MDGQIGGQPQPGVNYGFDQGTPSGVGVLGPPDLRTEFGAHLEANYPRLVAQLCMITLNLDQAHELVDEAYARAWQRWSTVRELPDPTGWVRQLAVRASGSRWRRMRKWFRRANAIEDPEQVAVLDALGKLTLYLRRPLVLADVAHLSFEEVARVENIVPVLAESRVMRARDELERALRTQPPAEAIGPAWEQM